MSRASINKGMTRGRLIFICVWLGIFAVAFLLWALLLGEVSNLLTEYEGVQPEYEAEEGFESYFATADAATIAGYVKKGFVKEGATYEELAAATGMPAEAFAEKGYNGTVTIKGAAELGEWGDVDANSKFFKAVLAK